MVLPVEIININEFSNEKWLFKNEKLKNKILYATIPYSSILNYILKKKIKNLDKEK